MQKTQFVTDSYGDELERPMPMPANGSIFMSQYNVRCIFENNKGLLLLLLLDN